MPHHNFLLLFTQWYNIGLHPVLTITTGAILVVNVEFNNKLAVYLRVKFFHVPFCQLGNDGFKNKVETHNFNSHILGTKAVQDSQPICKTILRLEIE